MATDLPDYTKKIAITVTVEQEQVPETPNLEAPVTQLGRYTGTATTYQTVATWTVATAKSGVLSEVSMESSNYAKTQFYLMVNSVAQFQDKAIQGPLSLLYSDLKMAAGKQVTVMAKSTDGTSITVDAAISGKEIG